jgi:hypothetical protein
MKAAVWMAAASLAVWVAVALWTDGRTRVAVLLGMVGPLVIAGGSWVLAERTYRRNPQALTPLMVAAFGFKLVFFGAYVAAMLALLSVKPMPFVASFVGSFVAFYLAVALLLRRLFMERPTLSAPLESRFESKE